MAKVQLEGVGKVYPGDVEAVIDFNLEVEDGEFVVLVGPSGCGKSTTLRMIAGLEEITTGTIIIGDREVNIVPPKDRDIAMVFQNYALYPHMNVYDNMAFGLKLRKFPKLEIEQRIQETAKMLDLQDLLRRKPRQLSGGQRQRVAVGRAIVRQPAAFLFDEPLSNLDAKLRVQMRFEIKRLHGQLKSTMLYVTHDQIEAMTMGDRIVVMNDGLIQQVSDPITLYDRPQNKFVAGFIGMPPMNFLSGQIQSHGNELSFATEEGRVSLTIPTASISEQLSRYQNQNLTLGVRPEDLQVTATDSSGIIGQIDVIEPTGAEVLLYVADTGSQETIVCRVDSHQKCQVGDTVTLTVPLSKPDQVDAGKLRMHFFDDQTGLRIN
ncbi:MAG: sn-glycerol-3-phosphate ABC transporter ATP-binding protein UgpC [Candidatus Poribacteria bacterium]|jgi:multiple sugar transport system ATP-binding protein|nr:sn-glycerol-3-phosphate ABC transporter ATP-binding protein UgpC [Candidatus Poribacteria bacterium]MDP6994570.1 sn-glycerol-3-phosphate ABC transporter ATP-binding protein UgpC [Candidatus Poribacteria bacterium]